MKKIKYKLVLISVIAVIFIIALIVIFINSTPDMSGNGRNFCLTFPEGLILQAPPPKNKLIRFMNKKYGVKFEQYNGDEFSEYGFRYSHTSAEDFDRYCNGIIVSTDEYPNHYFFVCDYYGEIHDDYSCHLAEPEAEQILKNELANVIASDFKVTLHPNYFQDNVFSEAPTGQDYLENGEYIIKIFICGDGENAENEFEKISECIRPYWDRKCFMVIYYLYDTFDIVDPSDYGTYSGDIGYNKMGQGWGYDDSGVIQSWEWIST